MSTEARSTETDRTTAAVALPALVDPVRSLALARTGVSDGRADDVFDRFARLAAVLLSAPVSYVSLVGQDTHVLPGAAWLDRSGEPERTLPLARSVCAFSVATGEETVVEDLATDPLFRDNAEMQQMDVSSYAGYPLTTADGHVLGTLCVMDRVPRRWTDEELAALEDLTSLVRQELRHRITRSHLTLLRDEVAALLAEVPPARESVRRLVEAARSGDDVRLQRTAATASSRVDRLVRASAGVTDDLSPQHEEVMSESVDVVRTARRVTAGVRAVTGSEIGLFVDPTAEDVAVDCDMLATERALSHLIVMAVRDSGDVPAQVILRRDGPGEVSLVVASEGGNVGAPQLGRAVARLDAATTSPGAVPDGARRAAVRISGGAVTATAGTVVGTVSSQGMVVTVAFEVGAG